MDSWATGRDRLLQEVSKVYDRIGAQIRTELDDENTIRIHISEWAAAQGHAAQSRRLEEENARLAEQLEQCKSALEEAKRDSKRRESSQSEPRHVQQKWQQTGPTANITPMRSNTLEHLTSTSSSHQVSATKVELKSATKTIPADKYNDLATRCNKLHDNWQHEKTKKEEWRAKCDRQRETLAQWEQIVEEQKTMLQRKDEIIKALKNEPRRSGESGKLSTSVQTMLQKPSSSMPVTKKTSWPPRDVTAPENPKSRIDKISRDAEPSESPARLPGRRILGESVVDCTGQNPAQPYEIHSGTPTEDLIICGIVEEENLEPELLLPQLPTLSRKPQTFGNHGLASTAADSGTPSKAKQSLSQMASQNESPEFLSTRCVKKRKGKQTATKSPKRNIKIEILSSPIGLARVVNSSDSLDLDDIGEKNDTPKKTHRLLQLARGRRAVSDDSQSPNSDSQQRDVNRLRAVSEQIAQETPTRQVGVSRKSSALQPLSVNKQILPSTSLERAPKRRRLDVRAVDDLIGDVGILAPQSGLHSGTCNLDAMLDQSSPAKVALSPGRLSKSTNHHTDRQLKTTPVVSGRISLSALPSIWEMPARLGTPPTLDSAGKTLGRKNLKSDLSTATPLSSKISTKSFTPIRQQISRPRQSFEEWELDPNKEPLRLRPVESLRVEDFKINASYNQGYDYAFGEVVRDRNTRQDLQGCTKPGCCGEKFRALALASSRNPNIPPTASQEEAEENLLKDFMGDNYCKLDSIGKPQRDELLMQARTRELANKHGRHRHAYERPASPPGFWRADFPTTQEEAEDRIKTVDSVKAQVRQRYEEAMRPNGRYLFRDE